MPGQPAVASTVKAFERPQRQHGEVGLNEKISFLSRPGSYPDRPAAVEVVHTHMSCVFLTDRHAYKLKKPVRCEFLDFSTLEARRLDCEVELRLNQRLARDVYLETVPLAATPARELRLGGGGETVEWLVKMRRLPKRFMLDHAIRQGEVSREEIRRCTLALAEFYRRCEPVLTTPAGYRQRFERDIRDNHRELASPLYGIAGGRLDPVMAALLRFLDRGDGLLEQRAREGRIVEGHGDLRPEHVYLGPEPLFIDCLEFNREWRLLDPAEELAYLAMECELAGAPWIGEVVSETYHEATGDDPASALVDFYKAYRACLRAKLSAWHLKDLVDPADGGKWIARAERYLELALRYAALPRA